jgi:hypothetical protein
MTKKFSALMTLIRLMQFAKRLLMKKEKMCQLTLTVSNISLVCHQIVGNAFAGLRNITNGQLKDVDLDLP